MAQKGKGNKADNLMGRWQEQSRSRQAVIVVLATAVIAFMLLFAHYISRPQYVTVYSNLEPAQASPLLQYLRERGVDYRLEDFGTTIKVPQDIADELRIELAGMGMPFAQGLGFELFDEDRLGMTDFERQVKMQRALQEELRRTITSLDAIMQARVHLALPEPSIFLREKGEPSAAVYLKLNPLVALRDEQVRGIVFLVASSVEDLKPENIVIIDSQGNILYDAVSTSDPYIAVADSVLNQLSVKRSFEMELERRVQTMLERVFGPGRVLALVTVDMDFDARETTVITYDDTGVPRSTYLLEETFEGEAPMAGEVGEANYPGYAGVVRGGDTRHDRREETVNYEIGESIERIIAAPGKVLSMHTSVVVDTGENPISEQEIEQINALVSSAIGFDEGRGDLISVQGMSFDRSVEQIDFFDPETDGRRQGEFFNRAVLGGAALVAVFLVVLALRGRRRLAQDMEISYTEGRSLEELLAIQEEKQKDFAPEVSSGETPQGRARKMVEMNPEVAVSVLRSWLAED